VDAKQVNKFIAQYAKGYQGGQFAAPLPKELEANPGAVLEAEGFVAIRKTLPRGSSRKDFTGRAYKLPPGASVLTHVAREPGAALPRWVGHYNYVYTYVEDGELSDQMRQAGWKVKAYRVSATSEIMACWCRAEEPPLPISVADLRTFTRLNIPVPVAAFEAELASVDCWHDDFPYYSDGTWSAVSIRGYKQDDPRWGVKPSEMPQKWRDEHPDDLNLKCDWTVLASRTPKIRQWVEQTVGGGEVERVRLFRMTARKDKDGKLGRHSDIQDQDVGTRDGMLARLHIPIRTHPDIKMTVWDLDGNERSAHLAAGGVYYLDTRKPHSVQNKSDVDRVHLVVDLVVTPEVRVRLMESEEVAAG
jgi:hypothetical protein